MKYLCLVYLDENRMHELPDEDCVEFDAGIRASGAGLSFGQVINNLRVETPAKTHS